MKRSPARVRLMFTPFDLKFAALNTLALGALSMGCGGGAVGEAVRPEAVTGTEAAGETVHCDARGKRMTPLVVDWPSQQRVELEAAMQSGIAVVRYACDEIEVLSHCSLEGNYDFAGVTLKEDVISIETRDQLGASFPIGVATFGASLDSSSSIQLAIAIVGKASSARRQVFANEVASSCDGATHVVRAATLGAFSMGQGTKGQVSSAAEIFDMGAEGSSLSAKDKLTKDGDLSACRKSAVGAAKPPAQCGATVRVELLPILPAAGKPATEPPPPVLVGAPVDVTAVPKCIDQRCGRALWGGETCMLTDEADCRAQCEGGDLASCNNLGLLTAEFIFDGEPAEQAKAKGLFQRACDGGIAVACVSLGELSQGKEADSAYGRACNHGVGEGCAFQASTYRKGGAMGEDPQRQFALYDRACKLGDGNGCWGLANSYQRAGPLHDVAASFRVLDRACQAGHAPSCMRLARTYYFGKDDWLSPGVSHRHDEAKAESYVRRRCQLDPKNCGSMERMFRGDEARRSAYRKLVCSLGKASACN